MRLPIYLAGLASAALLISGCGGGATASSVGDPTIREANYGPISTRAVGGVAEPVIMNGGQSTVTGIYGASFLNITVNALPDTPDYDQFWDTQIPISFTTQGRPAYWDFVQNRRVLPFGSTSALMVSASVTFNNTGLNLISSETDDASFYQIYSVSTDGKSRTPLTTGGLEKFRPSVSPATGQICYISGGNIWRMDANGANPIQLTTTGDTETSPKYSPDGTKIGYLRVVAGSNQIWEMDANGTNQVVRYNALSVDSFDYHPSEPTMAFVVNDTTVRHIITMNLKTGFSRSYVIESAPVSYNNITYGPAGGYVAVRRYDGTDYSLAIFNLSKGQRTDIMPMTSTENLGEWGPLPRKKFFVNATSASLHTNAAGFLFSTRGEAFTSLLAFDAQTRNTVDIDAIPSTSASLNYVATITAADKLTMLRYANGIIAPRVTIIDPAVIGTHAQGAVVSISTSNGRIGNVLTFTRSRDSALPATTREGDRLKFNHDFIAAYDGEGKLLKSAPKDVTMNTASGVVSFR